MDGWSGCQMELMQYNGGKMTGSIPIEKQQYCFASPEMSNVL